MTVGSTTTAAIEAVDASARSLYRRARASGQDFAEIATVVRGLHTVLKHLRVEAEDPDSLLNTQQQEGSVYARQLTPIVEDCDFTLKQLDTILEKYGSTEAGSSDDGGPKRRNSGENGRERDMMTLIRTKLANQKTNIDIFLDTVQLHNPAKARQALPANTDTRQLEDIKDKLDAIAARLFHRRRSTGGESEEELWQQFCTELVREGFSGDVLNKNKEVLRAYIRELDSNGLLDSASPPSVRGFLPPGPSMALAPASYPPQQFADHTSPKEMYHHAFENEKFSPSVKEGRPVPAPQQYMPYRPPPPPQQHHQQQLQSVAPQHLSLYSQNSGMSYDRNSSSDSESDDSTSNELALISTRDLIAFDTQSQQLMVSRMNNMHLSPQPLHPPQYTVSPGTSPNRRYLPPPLPPPQEPAMLSSSPALQALQSASPRFVPPLPYSAMTPPPAYGSSPVPQLAALPSSYPGAGPGLPPPPVPHSAPTHLAPDSQGHIIPPDATWTKINRRLVSPQVLDRAGVRYEARPTFVAVLGVLSKAAIAEFARQSAEVRGARVGAADWEKKAHGGHNHGRSRGRTGSTSDSESDIFDESDTSDDEKDRLDEKRGFDRNRYVPRDKKDKDRGLDWGADEKGTKSYPFVVPAPSEGKASPASTVPPKPILKNKNENHVRFDEDGPVEISASEAAAEKRREDRDRERRRERERDRERRRKDGDREYRERDRDRDRERDHHDRDRDRDYHGHRRHHSARDSRDSRDGRESRDRRKDEKEDRTTKKKALRETLGAVGIGGAAASLLSVLTEAAIGF